MLAGAGWFSLQCATLSDFILILEAVEQLGSRELSLRGIQSSSNLRRAMSITNGELDCFTWIYTKI